MVPSKAKLGQSISHKLLTGVLLGSSIMTFFITLFSLSLDYREGISKIEMKLNQIESLYLPGITQSLWDLNDEHVQLNLNGIIRLGDISYVYIEHKGQIQYFKGQLPKHSNIRRIKFPIEFIRDNHTYKLGTLVAVASLEGVVDDLIGQVMFVFSSSFVKTLILSAFMLLLFHHLVTKHLNKIYDHFRDIKISELGHNRKLKLERRDIVFDEFSLVVDSINHMQDEIQHHFTYKENAEKKLKHLNSTLEEEVRRRIKENEHQQITIQNSARLSSLGEMAGNIAHEINNPLTIISGYVSMLRRALKTKSLPDAKIDYIGERIESTIERITAIIKGLLRLSRDNQSVTLLVQPINPIIQDAMAICKEKFSSRGIEITLKLPSENLLTPCKPVEIGQIIINLLNNAFDEVVSHEFPWVEIQLDTSDNLIKLSVTDSGKGIPEEIRAKILEPFFTTKPIGKGTGLGLSISRAIAEGHNGRLFLDESSSNTKFVLELPFRGIEQKEGSRFHRKIAEASIPPSI